MRIAALSLGLLLIAAPALAAVGPTRAELAKAIAEPPTAIKAPQVRGVRCEGFGQDEPTEFHCRFQMRETSGAWRRYSTYVAVDDTGYHLIDSLSVRGSKRRSGR
jgi:hypothetical protein